MVVPPPTSRTHHDALKDIFFPTHSHHPSVPSGVFPYLLAELHYCHAHSATCYNVRPANCCFDSLLELGHDFAGEWAILGLYA